jgi:L-fuculose-phosphate aldolase
MTTPKLKASVASVTKRTPTWRVERTEVLAAAQEMARLGLVVGSSGNVSRRIKDVKGRDLMAVTPSSRPYETLILNDIVVIDFEGEPVLGDLIPSTESLSHIAVYQARRDVGSVMHTHSTYASAMAVAGLEIPALIDEMVILLGGPVRVAEYATPSSEELAVNVVNALGDRKAVLMRNHGLIGVGRDLNDALHACRLVEHVAEVYSISRSLGRGHSLPPDVVHTEMELYRMRLEAEQGSE